MRLAGTEDEVTKAAAAAGGTKATTGAKSTAAWARDAKDNEAAAAFVTSSSVPASRIFFYGCSVAADSNALVVAFVAFVPPAAGVVVAAVDATPSFAAVGADADAAGALGRPLLFPFLFLV